MPEGIVNVTEGSGKKLHTWQRIVGVNTVEDEVIIPGEYPYPSYVMQYTGLSIATANDHNAQLMAGATNVVRVRKIRVEQAVAATAAAIAVFAVLRLTTAGTGGTAVTARPLDSADAAAGATGIATPGVKGTEGVELFRRRILLLQAVAASGGNPLPAWEWTQAPNQKPLLIPSGATNGIVIKNLAAYAAGQVDVSIEFVETAFVG
jgi:hypothetical protein